LALNFQDGKNIVIFRPGAIGDTLLDTPLIRALKENFPHSKIIYFSKKPSIEILKYNKNVIPVEFSFMNLLRVRSYFKPTIFMDLKGNAISVIASRISGAKYRAGIFKEGRKRYYNVHIYPPFGKIHYTVYHRLEFLRPLGIDPMMVSIDTEFPYPEEYIENMKKNLEESGVKGFFFISHIRLDLPHRAWDIEKFCSFFKELKKKYPYPILLAWEPSTLRLLEPILNCAPVRLAPSTKSLFDLGALMRLAGVYFGSDSGPKHIAVSQGTPTFALFFTELPEAWTPPDPRHSYAWKGLPCQPCWSKTCKFGTFDCIHKLTPEEVMKRFEKFLLKIERDRGF